MRRNMMILPAVALLAGITAFAPAPAPTPTPARASVRARFHAHLVKAEPAVNDTISTTPKTVRLWFSEPVELGLSRVQVARTGGDTLKTGALHHEGSAATTASADLTSAVVPGTYVVTYHMVARDGHPTKGQYTFVVRSAPGK